MSVDQSKGAFAKIRHKKEPKGKGWQTWRGMLIKLWTSAISLLLLCCVLPMQTVWRTDGDDFIPAKQNSIMYALCFLKSY